MAGGGPAGAGGAGGGPARARRGPGACKSYPRPAAGAAAAGSRNSIIR
jgi:hypothetical protein